MANIEHCSCGKPLTEAERLIAPVIVERDRWRESAAVSEEEIMRLRDQLAGAVQAIDQALGLIETASSRARIIQARDVLRAAHARLAPDACEP
jgi:hypothetical protein